MNETKEDTDEELPPGWIRSDIRGPGQIPFVPFLLEPKDGEGPDQYLLRCRGKIMEVVAALTIGLVKGDENGTEDPDFRYALVSAKESLSAVVWYADKMAEEFINGNK